MCQSHKVAQFTGESWTVEQLEEFWEVIDNIGKEWGLTYPRQQIELISASQMIETICTIGAPCSYDHWSIGKSAIEMEKAYKKGKTGLALELVINSDPSIMYIMENNTLIQQGLVMAHAGLGHGSVFKNNYLFKEWTQPESILDYMVFSKNYVAECEQKYGVSRVEQFLDVCHALGNYGVSHHRRLGKKQKSQKVSRLLDEYDVPRDLEETVPGFKPRKEVLSQIREIKDTDYDLPEENVLYFFEKHSPNLANWQRELIRITRKMAEYFYPQTRCKVLHEGWASFIEFMVFEELYNRGYVDEGGYMEFIRDHTSVVWQQDYHHTYQLNPYALGFNIFWNLYRMTHSPTEAEIVEFPEICNTRWQDSLMEVVKNYTDVDLISRYLTSEVVQKMDLFSVHQDDDYVTVSGTAADLDTIRDTYVKINTMFEIIPRLEIVSVGSITGILNLKAYAPAGKSIDTKERRRLEDYMTLLWYDGVKIQEVREVGIF